MPQPVASLASPAAIGLSCIAQLTLPDSNRMLQAEALDAFSALAELADLAEANPEQSEEQSEEPDEPDKKRRRSHSRDRASADPLRQSSPHPPPSAGKGKAAGPGPSPAHSAAPMTQSASAAQQLERQSQQWSQQLQKQRVSWFERSNHILTQGGVKVSELESATAEAEQYLWGDDDIESVQAVADQLLDAKAWVSKVYAFTKHKPTLQALKPIVDRTPSPCSMPAFSKLKEAYQQAGAWLVRAADPLSDKTTELRAVETLCSEASRISVNLPEAKGLRETMHAARKLADSLRNLLPTNREAGRVRRKGEEPVNIEALRAMKVCHHGPCKRCYCIRALAFTQVPSPNKVKEGEWAESCTVAWLYSMYSTEPAT